MATMQEYQETKFERNWNFFAPRIFSLLVMLAVASGIFGFGVWVGAQLG